MRMNSFLQSKGNGKCIANFTSIYRTRETVFALKVCNIQIVCDSQGSYTVYLVLDLDGCSMLGLVLLTTVIVKLRQKSELKPGI